MSTGTIADAQAKNDPPDYSRCREKTHWALVIGGEPLTSAYPLYPSVSSPDVPKNDPPNYSLMGECHLGALVIRGEPLEALPVYVIRLYSRYTTRYKAPSPMITRNSSARYSSEYR